jgi:hypothetical protein
MGLAYQDHILQTIDEYRKNHNYQFEQLEITFHLGSPVVLSYPWICFDGLVAYGMGEIIFGKEWQGLASSGQHDLFWDELPIPLKESNNVYHASVGRFNHPDAQTIVNFFKLLSVEYLNYCESPQKRYMIVGGDFKTHKKAYPSISSSTLTFWVNGDLSYIEEICKNHLPGFGKRLNVGYGKIINFIIRKIPNDYSISHPEFGLNRPIPINSIHQFGFALNTLQKGFVAYKPPYWSKSNHVQCYIPEGFV